MPLTLLAAVALLTQTPDPDPRLLRMPNVHGDTVVFTYAGDLWVAKLNGGVARRLTSSNGSEAVAHISPDGRQVAFTGTYDGNADVYVMPIEGGEPKRLTFDPEADMVVGWHPNGDIAYTSTAGNFTNRQQRLWYVSPQGGLPKRTVIAEASQVSFYPDGNRIAYNRVNSYAYNWRRYRGGTQGRISLYDFTKNAYSELPTGREQNYFPMVVDDSIYYISDKEFGTQNLYRFDQSSKRATRITDFKDADIRFPSTDGKTIVYERNGLLYAYDIAGGKISQVAPQIFSENLWSRSYLRDLRQDIDGLALSPTGVRVLVGARGDIFSVPAKTGDTRNYTRSSLVREQSPTWSPDGRNIAYISDEGNSKGIYLQPQIQGEPTRVTSGDLPITGFDFSPDSKYIAYTLNDGSLYLLDPGAKASKLVFKPNFGIGGYEFSPDSKWIVFSSPGRNRFGALHLYEIATGKLTQITSGQYDDHAPTWDLSGKYLYFLSSRTFQPSFGQYEFSLKVEDTDRVYAIPLTKDQTNPLVAPNEEEPVREDPPTPPAGGPPAGGPPPGAAVQPPRPAARDIQIDLDGMGARAFVLPFGPASYRNIIGHRDGVIVDAGGTLVQFSFATREATPLIAGLAGGYALNASRTKLAYFAPGPVIGVLDIRPGSQVGQGRVDLSGLQAVINPRAEWNQMYWETWRYMRDEFYDPGMRGVNWKAIGDNYAKFLPYVNHRSDLNYVIGQMIGELGTGHSYVSGGDMGPGPRPIPVGNLGADFEASGDKLRFKKIYRGDNSDESRRSPLGEPGVDVNEGDYLLAIDGLKVDKTTHPALLLLNKVGTVVSLTVNSKPDTDGARIVRVRPIASEGNIRYLDFVETRRQIVEKASGGRIGYMHIPNTALEGAVEFVRGFYSQTEKDAVLVDERWNGGGYIQPWFVETLARKKQAAIQPRHGGEWEDAVAIEGPKALLINQYAGSGGDFFPWMFRHNRLGPLIGTRTWGGLVGIDGGLRLIDGGTVNAPSFAIFDRDTFNIIAENTGIDPDIDVDARPDLWAKGEDPQLQAGIKYLMDQLAKLPPAKPRQGVPTVGDKGQVKPGQK